MVDWDKYIEEQKFQKKFMEGTESERIEFCKEYLKQKFVDVPEKDPIDLDIGNFNTYIDYNGGSKHVQIFKQSILLPNSVINRDQGVMQEAAKNCAQALLPEIAKNGYIVFRQEPHVASDGVVLSAEIGVAKP